MNCFSRFRFFGFLTALILIAGLVNASHAQRRRGVKIKLGTVAPKNSIWHEVLLRMRQDWRDISGGTVDLVIYPGGVTGDEETMLRKIRAGQIQAAMMSSSGMAFVDRGVSALQVPMMFASYEEFDYVRKKLTPTLEKRIEEKGYKVLNWGDAGWAHFFAVKPFRTTDDVRAMKMYTSRGDDDILRLYHEFGFNPVPLDLTELQASLETGLVDVFVVPPLAALGYQWFGSAKNMLNIRFSPIVGATLIDKAIWEQIPADQREQMSASARKAGEAIESSVREKGDQAIAEMKKRGLNVIEPDAELRAAWAKEVEAAYSKLRGRYAPADLFDEVKSLRDEYRARK